ncbi:MAG: sarcosine oxidase subunit gamma [Rhodobacteraceae bacterium]|nr:sarcosine oxidase subunit gamma [Paracoccaceae bacterium]
MSDAVTALDGATFEGDLTLRDAGLTGMLTLRGDLGDGALMAAVTALTGTDFPAQGRICATDGKAAAWMSPDELLILLPYAEADAAAAQLSAKLAGQHHLCVNVSDARAYMQLRGDGAREILAKLVPADLAPGRFGPGQFRRTRLGEVATALWMPQEDAFDLICFRSVGSYVFAQVKTAIEAGRVGFF